MRNLILAGAAGLVLALSGASAFAIPTTEQIMSHGQGQDQTAVGAFLPLSVPSGAASFDAPAAPRNFGGEGVGTGATQRRLGQPSLTQPRANRLAGLQRPVFVAWYFRGCASGAPLAFYWFNRTSPRRGRET